VTKFYTFMYTDSAKLYIYILFSI